MNAVAVLLSTSGTVWCGDVGITLAFGRKRGLSPITQEDMQHGQTIDGVLSIRNPFEK